MKDLVQPRAALLDEGGADSHHLLHGVVPKDLDAVEGHLTGGKEVGVGEEDGLPHPLHARPAGEGGAAGGQPPGQGPVGPGEAQQGGEAGGGGGAGGEAPGQALRRAVAHRGHQGAQDAPQQQQGHRDAQRPLGPVALLDLAAEAVGRPRPLGVGVLAVPALVVQGHQVGLRGSGGGAAGEAQALALGVGAPHGAEEPGTAGGAVGQRGPLRHGGELGEGVPQGEDAGEESGGGAAGAETEEVDETAQQHIQAQHHGHRQKSAGAPHPQLEGIGQGPGQGQAEEPGEGQVQKGQAQQGHQHRAQPQQTQTPAVPAGQVGRGQIGGRLRRLAGLALPAGRLVLLLRLLLVHAGDELLEPDGLLRDLGALLGEHLLGKGVCLFLQMAQPRLEGRRVVLGELQHLVGHRRLFGLLLGRRRRLLRLLVLVAGVLVAVVRFLLILVLVVGRGRHARKEHHVLRGRGVPGLRPGQVGTGVHRGRPGRRLLGLPVLLPPAHVHAVLGQDLLQSEAAILFFVVLCHTGLPLSEVIPAAGGRPHRAGWPPPRRR